MRFHGWIVAAALTACPALAAAQQRAAAPAQPPLLDTSLATGSPQSARDIELEYHIETQLSQVPDADLSDVRARAVRGAVTLTGSVPDEAAHRRAIVAASGFFGVRVLRDELAVGPRTEANTTATSARGGGPADAWLELQAQRAAVGNASVGGPAPLAVARRGVVTMYGRVATFRAAHGLMRSVQSIPGVKAVRMEVQVGEVGFIPAREDLAAARR